MKINISLIIVLVTLPLVALGQSDKKNKVKCAYPKFPTTPLSKNDSCYKIIAKTTSLSAGDINEKIIIPGYVAVIAEKLSRLTGFEVIAGPKEVSGLPKFLKEFSVS